MKLSIAGLKFAREIGATHVWNDTEQGLFKNVANNCYEKWDDLTQDWVTSKFVPTHTMSLLEKIDFTPLDDYYADKSVDIAATGGEETELPDGWYRCDEEGKIKPMKPTTKKMRATDFLEKASNLLSDRAKDYDQPEGERSMGKTVKAFNAITGKDLTEPEGWLILQILKDVRQWLNPEKYHADSAEDCVSYCALKAEALMNEQQQTVANNEQEQKQ